MPAAHRIIDADGHIIDDLDRMKTYLEAPWDKRRGSITMHETWDSTLSGKYGFYHRKGYPASDLDEWLAEMDKHGIETTVEYPSHVSVTHMPEPDFAVAICRAYNNYFAEEFGRKTKRLRGVAMIPPQDPKEAARELRRAVTELGMVGGHIKSAGLRAPLGDRSYDPIWAAAQELGVPIVIHGTRNGSWEFGCGQFTTFSEIHTVAFPVGVMIQLTSILYQGVPERFPKLKLGFTEVGATWVPYWLDRMDEHWEKRGEVETPDLKHKPSDCVANHPIYFTVEAGEKLLPATVDYLGEDRLCYASDFPHWDNEFPHNIAALRARTDLGEVAKRKLFYDNAKALYGL
ncbi:MAG: amidohydrolase [Alphaproteobacteria bacterium]|nr:amidohydrolase [Alphaproteobacteria bacterium]